MIMVIQQTKLGYLPCLITPFRNTQQQLNKILTIQSIIAKEPML